MQTFKEANLNPLLARAIAEIGYDVPSPIQAQSLPILLGEPTDFVGLAATGTGKTAAFSIPMLEKIDISSRVAQALILCPTRELASQIAGQINLLGKYLSISALPIYGGSDYGEQIRGLKRGAQVIVGTPGRLVDHMNRGTLKLENLKLVILDEADEMISMGFKEDLETLLKSSSDTANTWLFSATMSSEVKSVAQQYLNSPKQVQVNQKEMLSQTVEQIYYMTQESNKPEVLYKLIDMAEGFYGLVFCQTKSLVSDLTQLLVERGYPVDCLHGDKDQNAREKTMLAFRNRKVKILICTDVASRGLDVKDVTHVINYSLPRELDNYVHRIGRTARSGKTGFALNLVTPSHRGLISRIERMTKSHMKEGRIPTRKDLGIKKVASALTQFTGQKNFSRALELLDADWKTALSGMSTEEVAARFLATLHPDVFAKPEEAPVAPQQQHKKVAIIRQEGSRKPAPRRDEWKSKGKDRGERDYRGSGGGGSNTGGTSPSGAGRKIPFAQTKKKTFGSSRHSHN